MSIREQKSGTRTLNNDAIRIIKDFYRDDEIIQACPGKRDYVVVTQDAQKTHLQQRMLILNLNEAYRVNKTKQKSYNIHLK